MTQPLAPRFRQSAAVPSRAEAEQPARVVPRAPRRVRARTSAQPMIAIDRAARGRSSRRSRPNSSPPEDVASIASTATRASRRTSRRTRRTSPRVFPTRGLPKHEGAGAVPPCLARRGLDRRRDVRAAAAAAACRPRAHRRQRHRLRAIVESPAFRRGRPLDGERLQRVPRGFPRIIQAAEYLRFRQFLAGVEVPTRWRQPAFISAAAVFRRVDPWCDF